MASQNSLDRWIIDRKPNSEMDPLERFIDKAPSTSNSVDNKAASMEDWKNRRDLILQESFKHKKFRSHVQKEAINYIIKSCDLHALSANENT